jgi:hypothetical protein
MGNGTEIDFSGRDAGNSRRVVLSVGREAISIDIPESFIALCQLCEKDSWN